MHQSCCDLASHGLFMAIVVFAFYVMTTKGEKLVTGHGFNADALSLAHNGEYQNAKTFFKTALEYEPENSGWRNDLAVTHIRLQEYESALKELRYILRGNPNDVNARANMKDLAQYIDTVPKVTATPTSAESGRSTLGSPGLLARIHVSDLYLEPFSKYVHGDLPYILTGLADKWGALKKWTPEYLSEKFGHLTTDFYPHNMPFGHSHPHRVKFKQAIEQTANPSLVDGAPQAGPPGPYTHFNILTKNWRTLSRDMRPAVPFNWRIDTDWLSDVFSRQLRDEYCWKTHWRILAIGAKNAGMFFHWDVLQTASWHAQIRGRKRWFICPPDVGHAWGKSAGAIDPFEKREKVDSSRYPEWEKAKQSCWDVTVEPGAILYYPNNYWHATTCLSDLTISITSTVATRPNHSKMINEFSGVCAHNKFQFNLNEELCDAIAGKLFNWWRQHLGDGSPSSNAGDDAKDEL